MQLGLGVLRLHPETFWKFTLRELEAVLASEGNVGAPGLSGTELKNLMNEHPDRANGAEDER